MEYPRALTSIVIGVTAALLITGCAPSTEVAESPSLESTSAAADSPKPAEGETGCPNSHGGECLGDLDPGTYSTSVFEPAITYTVPDGWTNFEDLPGNFWLFLQEDTDAQGTALGGSYLGIFQNVRAAAIDCAEAGQEGVGLTPEEMVAWYQSVPGLVVSEPLPVRIGGLEGIQIDLALAPDFDACDYGPYTGIPLIIGNGVSSVHHVILPEVDVRLALLSWQDGNVTLEITNVKEQRSADEFRSQLQPIIDGLVFES